MNSRGDATYVCLAGGLGNQLFQLSAGLYVSGVNPLILLTDLSPTRQHIPGIPDLAEYELPVNVSFQSVARPRIASTIGTRAANLVLRNSSASSGIFSNQPTISLSKRAVAPILRATLAKKVSVFGAQGLTYDPNLNSTDRNQLLIGYFQTWRYVAKPWITSVMQAISPRQSSQWLDELKVRSQNDSPLVVHVRLGDYRQNPGLGMVTPSYIEKALQHHRAQGHSGRVWLFSDEPEEAIKFLPDSERHRNPYIVTPPNEQEHPANVLEAMRLGTAFVLSNSSFGWWAARLSQCSAHDIVAPTRWFEKSPIDVEITPREWTQI